MVQRETMDQVYLKQSPSPTFSQLHQISTGVSDIVQGVLRLGGIIVLGVRLAKSLTEIPCQDQTFGFRTVQSIAVNKK